MIEKSKLDFPTLQRAEAAAGALRQQARTAYMEAAEQEDQISRDFWFEQTMQLTKVLIELEKVRFDILS